MILIHSGSLPPITSCYYGLSIQAGGAFFYLFVANALEIFENLWSWRKGRGALACVVTTMPIFRPHRHHIHSYYNNTTAIIQVAAMKVLSVFAALVATAAAVIQVLAIDKSLVW
jgi:hypothetical protein